MQSPSLPGPSSQGLPSLLGVPARGIALEGQIEDVAEEPIYVKIQHDGLVLLHDFALQGSRLNQIGCEALEKVYRLLICLG